LKLIVGENMTVKSIRFLW